jgi:aminoglycoside N3'-acetyltransferase
MNLTNYLEDYFQKGGILKSDKIMLHSNISYLWKKLKKDGLNVSLSDILDSLINYLGEKGLLIVPNHRWVPFQKMQD